MNKVTVVIPNYNGEKYLKGCLDSIAPSVQNAAITYDIIVVDDASTDSSRQIVKSYPNVKLIEQKENGGFSASVNAGIKASETPYVLLLNNDTIAKPGFVQNLYNAIKKDNKCFSVSASIEAFFSSVPHPASISRLTSNNKFSFFIDFWFYIRNNWFTPF